MSMNFAAALQISKAKRLCWSCNAETIRHRRKKSSLPSRRSRKKRFLEPSAESSKSQGNDGTRGERTRVRPGGVAQEEVSEEARVCYRSGGIANPQGEGKGRADAAKTHSG